MAVLSGSLELVKLLAGKGAFMYSEDVYGDTPLHKAIRKDYLEIGSYLLDVDLNLESDFDNGSTLLHFATMKGSIRFTEMLLERGANVNVRDEYNGNTPLHDVLLFLLRYEPEFIHRVYVNEDENEMETDRLDYPVHRDKVMKMKLLLERNADVNIENIFGETPLCIVMRSGSYPFIKLFLESAPELKNIKDENGVTPLTYAIERGQLDVIKLFLAKGADVNARNEDNTTSLSCAKKSGYTDIVKLLLDSGADPE